MSFLDALAAFALTFHVADLAPADERAALVQGVESIRTVGSPGSLAVWGDHAFVVACGDGGERTRAALIAAGPLGEGRVVLFGHDYLKADVLADAPTRTLVERLVSWAARAKPETRVKLLAWDAQLAEVLDTARCEIVIAKGDWTKQLGGVAGVLAAKQDYADREIDALRTFVERGGAFLAGKPGWGWMQVTERELVTNEVNRIVARAGLAFADGFSSPGADDRYALGAPPEFAHAGRAFVALAGTKKLAKDDERQALASFLELLRVLPDDDELVRPKLTELARSPASARTPTPDRPIESSDTRARITAAFDAVELRRTPVERVVAHPSAATFPGAVPANAPRVKRVVDVDVTVPRWHTTGVYAAPGERVVVELPESALALGLAVQIGVHTDSIWEKDWPRMPEITRTWPLITARTEIASAFGGLVELVVPRAQKKSKGTNAPVKVTIDGAVPAPLFVLGRDTNDAWKRELRARPAPWAELATSKVVLAVPSSAVRELDDPEALLRFWDQVLDAMADFAGLPHERASAERYVPDVMISAGYMHSGYPIMTFLDAVPDMTSLEKMKRGPWGLLHELGHNHQEDAWTFEGTGEVTNNVFVLYVLDVLCKRADWALGHDALKESAQRFAKYAKNGLEYADWCDDPFLALGMYVELREAFGWKPFTQVFVEERALAQDARPDTEQEKRDEWFTLFSRAVGKDLGPFFERWGVPVSAEARKKTRDLPEWDAKR